MKFTAFTFVSMLNAVQAEFSLSATASRLLGFEYHNNFGIEDASVTKVRFIVHGLQHEASSNDIAIISKTARAAYNHVFHVAGYSVKSVKPMSAATIPDMLSVKQPDCTWCPPDDDTYDHSSVTGASVGQVVLASMELGLQQPDCTWCPPDDDATMGSSFLSAGELALIHRKFEERFCAGLRASPSANLANVRDCSFAFLDMPGQSIDDMPVSASVRAFAASQSSEAQLFLGGTEGLVTERDMVLMDQAVKGAFNDVYRTTSGIALVQAKTVATMNVPGYPLNQPDCTWCPPDDDAATDMVGLHGNGSNQLVVMMRVETLVGLNQPDCTWCPPDDDATSMMSGSVPDEVLAMLHHNFEKKVCHKLKKIGGEAFGNVQDCSFRFVTGVGGNVGTHGQGIGFATKD